MLPARFKAILKTWDDQPLEEGYASVNIEKRTVDFQNEFVPLLSMGTTVKILQLQGEKEIHCFIGQVYLSSRRLLRIVSVSDDLLTEEEKRLPIEVNIESRLRLEGNKTIGIKGSGAYTARIYSLSPDLIKFTCPLQLRAGSRVKLEFERPFLLSGLVAEIYQSILFGESSSGYLCHVKSAPEADFSRLTDFVEQHNRNLPRLLPRI
ncbi:MAG: hypothetical protein HFG27_01270 [Provencibacterium sp.]|jgi:hypothetical protein|nr:hypothetical protein [Provencibacterium sp.]